MTVRGLGYLQGYLSAWGIAIIPDLPPSEGKKPGPSYINI